MVFLQGRHLETSSRAQGTDGGNRGERRRQGGGVGHLVQDAFAPDQAIVDLSRYATSRVLDQLRREAASVREPEDLRAYSDVIDWLRHRLAELDDAEKRMSAAALLVAWLAENAEGPADE